MNNSKLFSARKLTYFAVLVALVIVFQLLGGVIKIGAISLNFTLVFVVLCGMLLGVFYGALIGFIVGVITLIMVITGADAWTHVVFQKQPVVITVLAIGKSTVAGVLSALIYKIISSKQKTVASYVSAISAPIINTGIFVLTLLCIINTLKECFPQDVGSNIFYYIFIGLCGVNFLVELGINVLLAPIINRIIKTVDKNLGE